MEPASEELLFGRVVDRCDGADDWRTLEQLAAADPAVWPRLGALLRDDALLRAATAPAIAIAERVELPAGRAADWRSGGGWLGWVAAAAVAAAWLAVGRAPAPPAGVVGELPRLLVEAEPTADGRQLRVVSLRRVLEESFVDRAFRLAADERGSVHALPVELASLATPTEY